MTGLPRPDLPPGPHRDLVDALHGLHHRAGWPSLRVLAREAGCSHTTVSAVFSSPRLPSWGLLELLVEAMDGDVEEFRGLWLAAGAPESRSRPAAPRGSPAGTGAGGRPPAPQRRHRAAAGHRRGRHRQDPAGEHRRSGRRRSRFRGHRFLPPAVTDVPLLPIATCCGRRTSVTTGSG